MVTWGCELPELEFLERLHTLQGKVGAPGEAANPQTSLVISDYLRKLLDQYNKLSEIAPPAVGGRKQPFARQLTFLSRAFLLHNPQTTLGWILHTLFYKLAIVSAVTLLFVFGAGIDMRQGFANILVSMLIFWTPFGIVLLVLQRLARRNAVRDAAQLEQPNA